MYTFSTIVPELIGRPEEQPSKPIEDFVDENGVRTTVEYTVNDEGKKVKVRYRCVVAFFIFS